MDGNNDSEQYSRVPTIEDLVVLCNGLNQLLATDRILNAFTEEAVKNLLSRIENPDKACRTIMMGTPDLCIQKAYLSSFVTLGHFP